MKKSVLCMDIGGSKLLTGEVDDTGKVIRQKRFLWNGRGNTAVMDQLYMTFENLAENTAQFDRSYPVGLTIPGIADPEQGLWRSSTFLDVKDLPVSEEFAKRYGVSVALDNDANACAVAEKRFGGWENLNDFLYMTVSNSIGAAFYSGGRLGRGYSGMAGEIGLLPTEDLLDSGHKICTLESLASGRGLSENYYRLSGKENISFMPADRLQLMAEQGDPAASEAFRLEAKYLARAIAMATFLLNPSEVILGGGVFCAGKILMPAIVNDLHREMKDYPGMLPKLGVTKLGYSGGLVGAAALAFAAAERM